MLLNGHEVRHRAAELAPRDPGDKPAEDTEPARPAARHFLWLSKQSGVPVGTIHNATRDSNPQGISMGKVYDLAAHLARTGEDIRDVVAAIVLGEDKPEDDSADEEPEPARERPRDPSSPPARKNGKDDQRGPRRSAEMRRAS
jgi:hypothetical protein